MTLLDNRELTLRGQVNLTRMLPPGDDIRARPLNLKACQDMSASMIKMSSTGMDLHGGIRCADKKQLEALVSFSRECSEISELFDDARFTNLKIEVVVGNHRFHAGKLCVEQFVKQPKKSKSSCKQFFMHFSQVAAFVDGDAEAIHALKFHGNVENSKQDNRCQKTFADRIKDLRALKVSQEDDLSLDLEQKNHFMESARVANNFDGTSFKHVSRLIKMSKPSWDLFERILDKTYDSTFYEINKTKPQAVTGHSWFTSLPSLPDEYQIAILKRILSGQLLAKHALNACKSLQLTLLSADCLVLFVNEVTGEGFADFQAIQQSGKFPSLVRDELLQDVHTTLSAISNITSYKAAKALNVIRSKTNVTKNWQALIQHDLSADARAEQRVSVVFLFC